MTPRLFLSLALVFGVPFWVWSQGTPADFERAASLDKRFRPLIHTDLIEPHWLGQSGQFWFASRNARGETSFHLVDAQKKLKVPLFDHDKLRATLAGKKLPEPLIRNLTLEKPVYQQQTKTLSFFLAGKAWELSLAPWKLSEVKRDLPTLNPLDRIPKQSPNPGREIHLTFENLLAEPVEIAWLSGDGNRVSYGSIQSGAKKSQHTFENHVWLVLNTKGSLLNAYSAPHENSLVRIATQQPPTKQPPLPNRARTGNSSPDGKWNILVRDHNLFLKNSTTNTETQLTRDGTAQDGYRGQAIWSPDSSRFVALRTKAGDGRTIHLIESSPKDQVQPRLISIPYDKPGDSLDQNFPRLFTVAKGKEIPIDSKLFSNPWSITQIRWKKDSSRFTFLYNQRGHQVLSLLAVNAQTGATSSLIAETSKTFIDYSNKTYLHWNNNDAEFLWMSERDGFNHLYLVDGNGAGIRKQLTKGNWMVRGVDKVEENLDTAWIRIMGFYKDQDPYFMHYARLDLNTSRMTPLTESPGSHRMQTSPDGKFLLTTWSRADHAPLTELRDGNTGKKILDLHTVDDSQLRAGGWSAPEPFHAKGRDGSTDIYGIILRPTNFIPGKKYPVLEQIYAGPHDFHVPKDFRVSSRAQAMAELGFIIVQIDGMGTNWRGKTFHDVCWKNLADAGFPDRIAWMKAAAQKVPEMDLARVGIYGGSAGGQNAMRALIDHGDFYKAAAADCGCHDNRMDKVWWNELWMGWPVDASYEKSSNTVHADRLKGKLMLTVGELDRNVDPATTIQVANALIRAGKEFDLIVVPGAGHGAGEGPYAHRRRQEFFLRHLWGNPN